MKNSKKECGVDTCSLCKFCLPEWLPAVAANRVNYVYEKNEILFKEGEAVEGIYYVHDGVVKVHKHWGDDKELIVRFAGKGDIVGHRGFGTELIYPVSATALEKTTVCFIPMPFFTASLKVNHHYLYQLTVFFADELKESENRMRNIAHMSVKERTREALIFLETKFGKDTEGYINLVLSRQDIASYTGTTYETIFRVLQEFVNEGNVELEGKKIKLVNMQIQG